MPRQSPHGEEVTGKQRRQKTTGLGTPLWPLSRCELCDVIFLTFGLLAYKELHLPDRVTARIPRGDMRTAFSTEPGTEDVPSAG